MKSFDVIWIGTGQAAGAVIPVLSKGGKKIAIAEGGPFGGSCVNYGCTPTKTLVASARAAHMAYRGPDYGVTCLNATVDFEAAMNRQKTIRENGSSGLEAWLADVDGVELFKNYAQFKDEHRVRVGGEVISGDTIVIHTGARARKPNIPGIDEVDWLDNARLLDLDERPDHLVIIGGSYIGLEFGQAFRRLGSNVTILEKGPQLMFREDADIAETALDILKKEHITVRLNAEITGVAKSRSGVRVDFRNEDSIEGSHLLIGAGRQPNTDALNLQAAGVGTDKRGHVSVNDYGQTNVPHIFALGDVNGQGAFTHTSVNDGEVFVDYFMGDGKKKISDRTVIYNMYIDPPLGRVGMSEKQARQSGRNVLMRTLPMSGVARAKEKDETDGMIKILVDADSKEFLGAAVFGTGGDEIISVIATFMYSRQPYTVFRQAVLPHPTVAEMLPFVLDDLKPLT